MIKSCNSMILSLLVAFSAMAQMVHAQEGMEDVFAQLDAANDSAGQPGMADSAPLDDQASTGEESSEQASVVVGSKMVDRLLQNGVAQYKAGKYDEAIRIFDAVLSVDKYSNRAVDYRKRAAQRIASKEATKQSATRAKAVSDIDAAWNPEPRFFGAVAEADGTVAANVGQQGVQRMEERLKSIIIPSLDFNNASLEDVAFLFAEASRRLGRKGEDVDFAIVGMKSSADEISVSLSIADMNLYDALQFVADMTSLKFEVGENIVSIMPANYVPASQMVTKSYDINTEVGADLESATDFGGGMGDLFSDSSSERASGGPVDVSDFFSVVDFPKGASAIYQPRFKKLFVKNTSKNLKVVEVVLADLDEKAAKHRALQVEIEAKFVEFSEGALEELGFDWNIYGSGSTASMLMDPRRAITNPDNGVPLTFNDDGSVATRSVNRFIDPNTGQEILTPGVAGDDRPGQNLFGSAQRDNTQGFEPIQSGLLSLLGGTPATMMFGNGDIDLTISALEQEGTADILTAPRVTTKSGSEAIIRIAETHRYPQDYDAETGQSTAPVLRPQDWEDFDIGISLKVTPVVDADRGTIDLALHPEILEFIGFDTYVVSFNIYDTLAHVDDLKLIGDGRNLDVQIPAFNRRLVDTNVTVADGHTVVMGGLMDERTETFRDQVPFLGDIPFLGRLFRTEGSRNVKKNLTIFVKASLVDARGMTQADRELSKKVAARD